jgi:NADH:ubiquinone oxidoreductase subunit D
MANDPASMTSTISARAFTNVRMPTPDFRKMSDEELEHFINTFPSRYDIQGAIFEHDRRARQHDANIGVSRHKQTLGWTIVGAIAALVAAIAAVWILFR